MYADDDKWMRAALNEAKLCWRGTAVSSDVPVGAVCVWNGEIVGRAHNECILRGDPTLHAEVLAIRHAVANIGTINLREATVYVTLEPCPMCAGALWLARFRRVVFGAWDEKAGACGSLYDFARDVRLNHQMQLRGGVLESDCVAMLREFFASRR